MLQQCPSPSQVLAAAGPSGLIPREIVARALAQKLPGEWALEPKRVDSIRKLLPQYHESFHHLPTGAWSLACFELPAGASQDREAEVSSLSFRHLVL